MEQWKHPIGGGRGTIFKEKNLARENLTTDITLPTISDDSESRAKSHHSHIFMLLRSWESTVRAVIKIHDREEVRYRRRVTDRRVG